MKKLILGLLTSLTVGGQASAGHYLHPPYYAALDLPVKDRDGNYVRDPETGNLIHDGFCILWKSDWVGGEVRHIKQTDPYWFSAVSYNVDLTARTITFFEIYAPDVVGDLKAPNGWRRISERELKYELRQTVQLY